MQQAVCQILVGLLCLLQREAVAARAQPNIVILLTDDQGWGDLSCHGNRLIHTPNLDELSRSAVRFNRFFVSPVCAPTRASLLTGRFDARTGVSGVTGRREVMRAEEQTIAEVLRSAGYVTGCFGKWHNGEQFPNHPLGQGFDHFVGFCGGHWNNYFNPVLENDGRLFQTTGYITDIITEAAIGFVQRQTDRPFFCYIPFNAPHTPWQVPDQWLARYRDQNLDVATQCAYAMVENIDHNIGRLLSELESQDIHRDTIVIFLTDNGPNGRRFNGNMRGIKGSVHEGGTRVPLFLRWTGSLTPRTISRIAAHVDLLPTIMELCGISQTMSLPLDGRSLVPLISSPEAEADWPDRKLMTLRRSNSGSIRGAVRTQQFRFVREATDQLYDMDADPRETKDLSDSHPAVLRDLRQAFEDFVAEVRPVITDVPPIPAGYPDAPTVELPAVESQLSEGVRFYNGQGYAHDWITGLDTAGENIVWHLENLREGLYRIDLSFACPETSTGATVIISDGVSRMEWPTQLFVGKIEARPERVTPAGERWIRNFHTTTLGRLQLRQGMSRLRLELADNAPGGLEIDAIRLVRLPQPN